MLRKFSVVLTVLALLTITFAETSDAARRRAFSRGSKNANKGTLVGTITDSVTGAPVFDAGVCLKVVVWRADVKGRYELYDIPPGMYTAKVGRWGYAPKIFPIEIKAGLNTLNVTLDPKPVATLKDHTGTHTIDAETTVFNSWFPLAQQVDMDPVPFFLADGTARDIAVADIKSINGPGQLVRHSSCPTGMAVRIAVTLRSGETLDVYFPECQFYRFVVSGHDRVDGKWHYPRFSEVESLQFP
jgi:hypothetical protein